MRSAIPFSLVGMSGDLVQIASYATVWEADLACNRLAVDGITAFLGNAALVSWSWHYSNLVGGVTVHVARRDAETAMASLRWRGFPPAESRPPWTCPKCGARVFASWDACWNCADSTDGLPSPGFDAARGGVETTASSQPTNGSTILAVFVAVLLIALISHFGPLAGLAGMPLVVLVVRLFQTIGADAGSHSAPADWDEPARQASCTPMARGSRVASAIILRAWRAAVIGVFMFPPLSLYSLWLLARMAFWKMPLSRIDRLRCGAALVLDACSLLIVLLFGLVWVLSFEWLAVWLFILARAAPFG